MTQNPRQFDWDDLRHLLAVAQHGSTLAAGRALGVDQSTVQRRLAELERRIGLPLVRRETSGYQLTEFGLSLLPYAQAVEADIRSLEQHVARATADTTGVVRVTCPEPIVLRITQSGFVARFEAAWPGLKVQWVISDRYVDLLAGEADVALRSGDTDDGDLIGRKLADSVWALYASRAYIERHGRPDTVAQLKDHALVGFDASMARHRLSTWLERTAPGVALASRAHSVLGLVSLVKSGVGIAPLPLPLGDAEADLVKLCGPLDDLTRSWRVLTTAELRRVPRVSAFIDFVLQELEALRPILTG